MKVHELAEKFKMSSAAMVQMLKKMGIPVNGHMSTVDENLREQIKDKFEQERTQIKKEYERKKEQATKVCEDVEMAITDVPQFLTQQNCQEQSSLQKTNNELSTKRNCTIMENTLEIKFIGAIGTVTGSCTALKFTQASGDAHYYLVDIGEYQGESKNANSRLGQNWLIKNAKRIEGIFITHAHLDHVGFLPELVMKHGFTGKIYCSTPTKELMEAILADSLHINNAPYKVNEVFDKINEFCLMDKYKKGTFFTLCDDLRVSTLNSGHVLGSNIFQFTWKRTPDPENGVWENIYFSGDIGPNTEAEYSNILLKGFQYPFYKSDNPNQKINIVLESTYGYRSREHKTDLYDRKLEKLADIVTDAIDNNRTVIFPAFALNRAQEVLLDLQCLKVNMKKLRNIWFKEWAQNANLNRINKRKNIDDCFVKKNGDKIEEDWDEIRKEFIESCKNKFSDFKYDPKQDTSAIPHDVKILLCDLFYKHSKPFDACQFTVIADSKLMGEVNTTYKKYLLKTFEKKDGTLGFEYLPQNLFKWLGISDSDNLNKIKYARCLADRFLNMNVSSPKDKKKKTDDTGSRFIVTSSGMCDEGAIVECLRKYLPDENAVVAITGYQAKDTNGYHLKNMHTYTDIRKVAIRLKNIDMQLAEVKCKVIDLSEYYSGHADQETLVRFVTGGDEHKNEFQTRVFLNHGQDESRAALKEQLEKNDNIKVTIPDNLDWHNLNTGESNQDDEPVVAEPKTSPKECGDIKGVNVGDITVLIPEYYGEITIKKVKAYLKALIDSELQNMT